MLVVLKYVSLAITSIVGFLSLFWEPRDDVTKRVKKVGWWLFGLLAASTIASFWIQSLEIAEEEASEAKAQAERQQELQDSIDRSNAVTRQLARIAFPFEDVGVFSRWTLPLDTPASKHLAANLAKYAPLLCDSEEIMSDGGVTALEADAGMRVLARGAHSIDFTNNTALDTTVLDDLYFTFQWPLPELVFFRDTATDQGRLIGFRRPMSETSSIQRAVARPREALPFYFHYDIVANSLTVVVNEVLTASKEWQSERPVSSFMDFYPSRVRISLPLPPSFRDDAALTENVRALQASVLLQSLTIRVKTQRVVLTEFKAIEDRPRTFEATIKQ